MMLFSKQAFKFLVAFSVLLGVFTEAYAGTTTLWTTNGTVGTAYNFNLRTMTNAGNNSSFDPVTAFNVPGGLLGAPAFSYRGLTFDQSSVVAGNPNTQGIFIQYFQILTGVNQGGFYEVTFDIAAASSGGGGGDPAPVCSTCFDGANFLSGQTYTVNGGVINQSLQPSSNATIIVGPEGATLNLRDDRNRTDILYTFILNGPLRILNSSGVNVTPASGTQRRVVKDPTLLLNGNISGTGSITVVKNTDVRINGNNTYTGGTTIEKGANLFSSRNTLIFSGPDRTIINSFPPGQENNTPLGSGHVVNYGYLSAYGKYPGTIESKDGAYTQTGASPGWASYGAFIMRSGSTYLQDITGTVQANATMLAGTAGTYSFAEITGGLFIESGTTLTPRLSDLFSTDEPGYGSSIYIPLLGDRFRIFTAAGGITGRFTTLTQPAELSSGTQMIALYNVNNGNSVDLAIAPTSYSTTLSSSTTNAKAVASVLDQLLGVNKAGTSSSAQDSLLYAVAGQNAANLPGFARSLAGEVHAASVATLPQTTQRVQQAVLARLGDYPMAPSQINPALSNAMLTGGISATNTSGLPTANMSTNPAVNPNAVNVTSAAVADGRAWGEIAYQRTERASNSAGNGYNSNLYQIVTGVDAYSNAELGLKLGGGIALSNTTVSANGGNSTIQQGSLFAYGKMSVLQDYVLDGMASVGMSSTNLSRNDPTGYTGGFSSKAVMGNDALVSVGLSRAFEYNEVRVTPYARLSYQYVGQNSYDEGSGAAALNIARISGSAARGVIGLAAGSLNKAPLKDDYTYRANLAVGADTSGLLNPTLNTTLGGYSSSVTTATAGSAFVQVGLYGTVKISDNAYAYAGVSGEARTGQTLYGGSVGLRVAF